MGERRSARAIDRHCATLPLKNGHGGFCWEQYRNLSTDPVKNSTTHSGGNVKTKNVPQIAFILPVIQIAFPNAERGNTVTFRQFGNSAIMSTISVIRHSNGRMVFPCNSQATMPTNPRLGPPTSLNTVTWSESTRAVTLIIPRQNGVNIDSWDPQSRFVPQPGPTTYVKPPVRTVTSLTAVFPQTPIIQARPAASPNIVPGHR